MPTKAKEFRYAIELDRSGRPTADGQDPLELTDAWTPEHLLLAALARCTLASLRFHADRMGVEARASASASGRVTKREEDGRYAFVEIESHLDVELEPPPAEEELESLIVKAERDCFIGASLTAAPRYRWTVNGAPLE
ncbi:MAG: OsmC family protein [Actinomycetota bacterium]|nr:OsmC family protein [Actinomycetota bacterium]